MEEKVGLPTDFVKLTSHLALMPKLVLDPLPDKIKPGVLVKWPPSGLGPSPERRHIPEDIPLFP